eukprot:978226-Alexandrium_andersonii.AAC.1
MSASLVGSEMCIRDSMRAARETVLGSVQRGSFRRVWAAVGGVSSLKPVSYTHLTLPTICSV